LILYYYIFSLLSVLPIFGGIGQGVQHAGEVGADLPVEQRDHALAVGEGLLVDRGEDGEVDPLEPPVIAAPGDEGGVAGDLQAADGGLVDGRHALDRKSVV